MWTIGTYWSLHDIGMKGRNRKMGRTVEYNWKGVKKFRDFGRKLD